MKRKREYYKLVNILASVSLFGSTELPVNFAVTVIDNEWKNLIILRWTLVAKNSEK